MNSLKYEFKWLSSPTPPHSKVVKIKARPPTEQTQAPPPSSTSEPQTQLPLKIQDSDRTEYVAPVSVAVDYILSTCNFYGTTLHVLSIIMHIKLS